MNANQLPAAIELDRVVVRQLAAKILRRGTQPQSVLTVDLCGGLYHIAFVRSGDRPTWAAVTADGHLFENDEGERCNCQQT